MTKPKPKYEVKKSDNSQETQSPQSENSDTNQDIASSAAPTPTEPSETKKVEPSAESQSDVQPAEKSTGVDTTSPSTTEDPQPMPPSLENSGNEPENPLPRHPTTANPLPTSQPSAEAEAQAKSVVGTMADGVEEDFQLVGPCAEGGNVYRNLNTGEKVYSNKMTAIARRGRVYPYDDKAADGKKKVVIQ